MLLPCLANIASMAGVIILANKGVLPHPGSPIKREYILMEHSNPLKDFIFVLGPHTLETTRNSKQFIYNICITKEDK